MAIVAGSKVSTKLTILESLADKVDQLIVGGGIANTFPQAEGKQIGKSLAEPELLDEAKKSSASCAPVAAMYRCHLTQYATEFAACRCHHQGYRYRWRRRHDSRHRPQSAQQLAEIMARQAPSSGMARSAYLEFDQFGNGTKTLAETVAASPAFSIAGGGDTWPLLPNTISPTRSATSPPVVALSSSFEGKILPAVEIRNPCGKLITR